MAKEIEHKYLVRSLDYRDMTNDKLVIYQGYISKDKNRTVRVRTCNNRAFLTIKGITSNDTRDEYEYSIPYEDAMEMLRKICLPNIIEKTRYKVMIDSNLWEIDEFHGRLEGLIIAEIELPSSDYKYSIPHFIGENVTGNPKYYNSNL